jgi:hypothetical protein
MGQVVLKRAAASRVSGEWSDDGYDVLCDGAVVGRIMKAAAAPVSQPWLWTLAYGHHERPHADLRLRGDARDCDGSRSLRAGGGNRRCPAINEPAGAFDHLRGSRLRARPAPRSAAFLSLPRCFPQPIGGEAVATEMPV